MTLIVILIIKENVGLKTKKSDCTDQVFLIGLFDRTVTQTKGPF